MTHLPASQTSTATHAHGTGRAHAVHYLPVPRRPTPDMRPERVVHEARYVDGGIHLRVGWDGTATDPGCFQVQSSSGLWLACPHTAPDCDRNDVVHATGEVGSKLFLARFQRGPTHPGCAFDVKAILIVGLVDLSGQSSDFVAVRGRDYKYADGAEPENIDWNGSSLEGEVQRLTVVLETGRDYELWVRLYHPGEPGRWLILDPIVRTGNAGGGQDPT
jgi:hypothetical protein